MYLLYFYAPESHVEQIKLALFRAGAGNIGHYECCCWQTKGLGQFKGKEPSRPFIGKKGLIEQCEEYRVEMVFRDELKTTVISALKKTHPYETPAFGIIKLESE